MADRWLDAEGYERYVGRWSRKVGARFLAWLDAPEGARWLDLGAGTGALTETVLHLAAPRAVVAVEPSEAFLGLARDRLADPRVDFRPGAAVPLPAGDGEADVAVSGFVLNFVPDPEAALAELARAVAPGGTVAAYVWDYAGHVQFMRRFWDAAADLDPAARALDEGVRFPLCRPAPLEALFAGAGLRDVAVVPIDIATPFADFDDYWTPFLSGVGPAPGYCVSLAPEARDRLRERLRATLPADPDGAILLAARAWAVRGTR